MKSMRDLVRAQARMIFRRRTLSSGEQRGLKGYYSFEHGERPSWWTPGNAAGAGDEPIGVYEVSPGAPENAVVITPEEVIMLGSERVTVRYADLDRLGRLEKEPLSKGIDCFLRDGTRVWFPVENETGAVATIQHFLLQAMSACKRHSKSV